MKIISGTENIQLENTIVIIGKFDGIHRGHRKLLDVALKFKTDGLKLVFFTFDRNPAELVHSRQYKKILTHSELRALELKTAADIVIEYPFTEELRNMSPEQFSLKILKEKLGAKVVVCGDDFRFGKDRTGNAEILASSGEKYGFEVYPIEKLSYKGRAISSTYIKECISAGNIDDAEIMLGRPYSITGTIEHGRRLGTDLGFPTANIRVPEKKITPPYGVYAVRMNLDGKLYPGIANLGTAPTFHEDTGIRMLETNLFDLDRNIYGEMATVFFYKFIRPERVFENGRELADEVARNIEEVKKFLL